LKRAQAKASLFARRRFDHGDARVVTGELVDGLHRVPQRDDDELDTVAGLPTQQLRTLVPAEPLQLREHGPLEMVDIPRGVVACCLSTPDSGDHRAAPSSPPPRCSAAWPQARAC
jgi:hypothetical protein